MTDPGAGGDVVAGRYALVDPIGSGGTGTVWRAWDRQRQQWCAAKVMRQRHSGELLRFAREQSVRLIHPHVASPYAWAADDGTVLIASELLDGGSLHTLVGDYGALDTPTVVVLLDQVLSGLAAVHDAGLVHRDVTPGNVLLRATGDGPLHTMLTDFGLAIGANDARLTGTGMVIGTPGGRPAARGAHRRGVTVAAAGRLCGRAARAAAGARPGRPRPACRGRRGPARPPRRPPAEGGGASDASRPTDPATSECERCRPVLAGLPRASGHGRPGRSGHGLRPLRSSPAPARPPNSRCSRCSR